MKTNKIFEIVNAKKDLPKSIEKALANLYGVEKISDLSVCDKKRIYTVHNGFFNNGQTTDYSKTCNEYAVFYFPVNFYKVWRPMCDLLEKSQIKDRCEVLEMGCGPGSSTFGFIEFYKVLAGENPNKSFEITIYAVEQSKEFIDIMKGIYNLYKCEFPKNLSVNIYSVNSSVKDLLSKPIDKKFDYVIESNMINPNESLDGYGLRDFSAKIQGMLKPHASVIFIEPSEECLSKPLKELKKIMLQNGMTVYSPCSCGERTCKQFVMARVDISGILLLQELKRVSAIPNSKLKKYHNFEYVVFRNDELKKFEGFENTIKFSELSNHVGEKIKFKAYILIKFDNDDSYRFKICDGSCEQKKEIWLDVPKSIFNEKIEELGRGGFVSVKNAKIISDNRIACTISSSVQMEM